ncbi:hypothetical protein [Tautonia sociabilis]|uniref:Uncharacterized protein n=1 Tax=Tautonia sociabilis TaxID=2080755 RepID=A0A432MHG9_9BACT|nr:hypothetical protein [Tautonia sociabilis]RUL86222.1 hypothetical protein TsocGM_16830 [Tautonia sociabilis]
MPVDTPIEQRLAAVEAAVAELQRRLPPTRESWLELVVGSFKDEPAFEEVLALGRAFRESDRPQASESS